MGRMVRRSAAVALALTMLGATSAEAATSYNTRIRLRAVPESIERGEKVVFKGRLMSPFPRCSRNSRVTLYRRGNAVVSKRTDSEGFYRFEMRPNRTRRWQVRFAGKTGGTHPDQWVCEASRSDRMRVRVTG